MSAVLKGVIRNGRVVVDEPMDWPEGTAVVVAPEAAGRDDGPLPSEEIARMLAPMRQLLPLESLKVSGPTSTPGRISSTNMTSTTLMRVS
jgi:hypothetical protein